MTKMKTFKKECNEGCAYWGSVERRCYALECPYEAQTTHLELDRSLSIDLIRTAQYLAKEAIGRESWAKLNEIDRQFSIDAWTNELSEECKDDD